MSDLSIKTATPALSVAKSLMLAIASVLSTLASGGPFTPVAQDANPRKPVPEAARFKQYY